MVEEKVKTVEKELEEYIDSLEQYLLKGEYSEAFKSLQRAKALTHYIKVNKLWSKGNKYFALMSQVKEVREAYRKKNAKELEEKLNRVERLLLD